MRAKSPLFRGLKYKKTGGRMTYGYAHGSVISTWTRAYPARTPRTLERNYERAYKDPFLDPLQTV